MAKWPDNVSIEGNHVCLELLDSSHENDLREAAADGELHRLWYTSIPKPDQVTAEIKRRLALRDSGSMLPFAVLDKTDGKAVGMTTYMNIDSANRRLEIGSTWYRQSVQKSR